MTNIPEKKYLIFCTATLLIAVITLLTITTQKIPNSLTNGLTQEIQCEGCNVVLISVEPLRRDHISIYNNSINLTPTLEKLAQKSTTYNNAYTTAPYTTMATASTFTSLYPSQHKIKVARRYKTGRLKKYHLLVNVLENAGYQTYYSGTPGKFKDFFNESYRIGWEKTDKNHKFWKKILEEQNEPFFLYIQRYYTHQPYGGHSPYNKSEIYEDYQKFLGKYSRSHKFGEAHNLSIRTNEPLIAFNEYYYSRLESDPQMRKEAMKQYDGGVRHSDTFVRKIREKLEKEEIANNTIIVFMSHHGESFNEHGIWSHDNLYNEVMRIPLLIHIPNTEQKKQTNQYTQNTDIAPTILDLLQIQNQTFQKQTEGTTLTPTLKGQKINKQHIYAGETGSLTAYINPETNLKYMRTPNGYQIPYPLNTSRNTTFNYNPELPGHPVVYNLTSDPGEQHPIQNQKILKEMRLEYIKFRNSLKEKQLIEPKKIHPYVGNDY